MQEDIKNTERIEMGFSDLIIGAECGVIEFDPSCLKKVIEVLKSC